MRELWVNDVIGSILRKGYYGHLKRMIGRSEGSRATEDRKTEIVLEPDNSLRHITARSRFNPIED